MISRMPRVSGVALLALSCVLMPQAAYAMTGGTHGNSSAHSVHGASGLSLTASGHGQSGTAATRGSPSSPQPYSNADYNNTGANDTLASNQYRSTRNGSLSGNGRGSGKAVGKPCAGCVGKADNKNPHGQYPNGTDHNAGYECDRNQGIGQTNPAHTGCKVPTTPTVPTVPATPTIPQVPVVPPTNAPGSSPTTSFTAVTTTGNIPLLASARVVARVPGLSPTAVPAGSVSHALPGSLVFTGSDPAGEVLAGGLLMASGGLVLVWQRRKRRQRMTALGR